MASWSWTSTDLFAKDREPKTSFIGEKVLFWQQRALQLFGILPRSSFSKKSWHKIPFALAGCILMVGGWIHVGLLLASVIAGIVGGERTGPTQQPLLNVIISTANPLVTMHGVLCLTLFHIKAKDWWSLLSDIDDLIRKCYREQITFRSHVKGWRISISMLTTYSVGFALVLQALHWYYGIYAGFFTDYAYSPLKVNINLWQQSITATVFGYLPMFLGQQVSILLIVFCLVLRNCIVHLDKVIEKCTERAGFNSVQGTPVAQKKCDLSGNFRFSLQLVEQEVVYAMHMHSKVVRVCEKLNETFGLAFVAGYCLDLIAAVGYLAGFILNENKEYIDPREYIEPLALLVWAVVNVTFFLVPAISMHEQSLVVNRKLCRFSDAALQLLQLKEGRRLKIALHLFLQKSKDEKIVIEGLHIFYATRHLLVTTLTVPASLLVIASEILHRATPSTAHSSSSDASTVTHSASVTVGVAQ